MIVHIFKSVFESVWGFHPQKVKVGLQIVKIQYKHNFQTPEKFLQN